MSVQDDIGPNDTTRDTSAKSKAAQGTGGRVLSLEERKARRQQARPAEAPLRDRGRRHGIHDEQEDPPLRHTGGSPVPVAPPALTARVKERHWGVMLSFVLLVILPIGLSGWYLWTRTVDRYLSTAGFSVRTEDIGSAFELLGGMASMGSSSSNDNDILYNFIQSQDMVAKIDAAIDLRALWAKSDPVRDPVFAYHPPGTIEDMVDYWNRMVSVYSDSSTGLIDIQVEAFTPQDARMLAQMIYDESSTMINRLSAIAQEDATRFARQELDEAVERLRDAREAVTRFRNVNQIFDPAADIQSQMGILSSLDEELAKTLVDLDILRQTTAENDPRIAQAQRRVEVIEARMAEERARFGIGTDVDSAQGNAFADIVGEYERLTVDREFAEQSYAAARGNFEAAISESRRQSRYLAAHVQPTLAEKSEYPQRATLLSLVALFSFLSWAMIVLAVYALKDRR